jgi:hypothetical protein
MALRVECRDDELGPVPVRFGDGELLQEVDEIVDRWWGEGHAYVRVRTRDGARWILRRDAHSGAWQVAVFDTSAGT